MSRQNHSPRPSGPHQVTRSAVTSRLAVHTNSQDSGSAVYSCRVPRNTHKCLWFLGVSVSLLSPISGNSRCTSSREDMYRTKPKRLMGQLSPSQASFLRIQFLGTLLVIPGSYRWQFLRLIPASWQKAGRDLTPVLGPMVFNCSLLS